MTACKQPLCAMTHLPCYATSWRGHTKMRVQLLFEHSESIVRQGGRTGLPLGSSHAKVFVRVRTSAAVPFLEVPIPVY